MPDSETLTREVEGEEVKIILVALLLAVANRNLLKLQTIRNLL